VTGVRIEGAITGLGKFVATGATIPAASEVTISGLTADTVLPSATKYYNLMTINWSVSADGSACTSTPTNCATTGSSANKVYVTLIAPLFPVVLTPLHLAVSNDGATTPAEAFQKTWAQFAGPANVTAWDGRKLYYYRPSYGFDVCAVDPFNLLNSYTGSGQCGSFAQLLRWSLGMNGIPSDFVTVSVLDGARMLVKDWTFGTPSYPADPLYQWQIVLNPGDYMVPPQPTAPLYGDLRSLDTLPGQNTRPPSEKVFGSHFIVKVDPSLYPGVGPYFDPSYGVWYSSSADFEAKAIDGYLLAFVGDSPGVYRVRRPGGSVNIGLVP
jgi:hypothetical protein